MGARSLPEHPVVEGEKAMVAVTCVMVAYQSADGSTLRTCTVLVDGAWVLVRCLGSAANVVLITPEHY